MKTRSKVQKETKAPSDGTTAEHVLVRQVTVTTESKPQKEAEVPSDDVPGRVVASPVKIKTRNQARKAIEAPSNHVVDSVVVRFTTKKSTRRGRPRKEILSEPIVLEPETMKTLFDAKQLKEVSSDDDERPVIVRFTSKDTTQSGGDEDLAEPIILDGATMKEWFGTKKMEVTPSKENPEMVVVKFTTREVSRSTSCSERAIDDELLEPIVVSTATMNLISCDTRSDEDSDSEDNWDPFVSSTNYTSLTEKSFDHVSFLDDEIVSVQSLDDESNREEERVGEQPFEKPVINSFVQFKPLEDEFDFDLYYKESLEEKSFESIFRAGTDEDGYDHGVYSHTQVMDIDGRSMEEQKFKNLLKTSYKSCRVEAVDFCDATRTPKTQFRPNADVYALVTFRNKSDEYAFLICSPWTFGRTGISLEIRGESMNRIALKEDALEPLITPIPPGESYTFFRKFCTANPGKSENPTPPDCSFYTPTTTTDEESYVVVKNIPSDRHRPPFVYSGTFELTISKTKRIYKY